MSSLWIVCANLVTAIWVGTIVYQSTVVAATVLKVLDGQQARRFLRIIFPRFYSLGLICALTLLVCMTALGFDANWARVNFWLLSAVLVMTTSQLISIWLVPRINAAADVNKPEFKRLHVASVMLTVVILVLGTGILILIAGGLNTDINNYTLL